MKLNRNEEAKSLISFPPTLYVNVSTFNFSNCGDTGLYMLRGTDRDSSYCQLLGQFSPS